MADLKAMLDEVTSGEKPNILGVVAIAVDHSGKL